MQNLSEEAAAEIPACVHHWMLNSPVGGTTSGQCRACGELRNFTEAPRTGAYLSRTRRK